ncbi:MAG: methyltransferase domain-containing protein [Candidatus Buchananbacteria bacterium]
MIDLITILLVLTTAVAIISLLISLLIGTSAIALFAVKVPFAPTPKRNVKIIIDQLNLKPGQIFYDLGCGDARFLIEAESRGAKATGFEIAPWAIFRAHLRKWFKKSQVKIIAKNFYHINLSDADAVFCFLITKVMPKVEQKLQQELKPGALIACYGFPLPTWNPEKIISLKPANPRASKIYLYKK